MKGPLARSLSLRLLAIFTVTGIALIAVLAVLFTGGLGTQWRRGIQPHLERYVAYLQADLGMPPNPARADAIASAVPIEIALYRAGKLIHSTDGQALRLERLRFRTPASRDHDDRPLREGNDRGRSRRDGDLHLAPILRTLGTALARPVSVARDRGGPVLRIDQGDWSIYYRLDRRSDLRHDITAPLLAVASIALLLLASWWLIRRELQPIGRIGSAVERMSAGDLDARTGVSGVDDLAILGNSVDEMAARLRAMLDAKRELLLAVSHELRSPLARARVALALIAPSATRDRLDADLKEMGKLIDDLLETERLREPHGTLQREQLDFARLVADELEAFASVPDVRLDLRIGSAPIAIDGDATRLRLLVRNLVANASTHGRGQDGVADIGVSLEQVADWVVLGVRDHGPGVDIARLDQITEPFERLDESRSRVTGGVGLGLTLARLVAEAHGGTLELVNADGGGLSVKVRLRT